MGRQNVSEKFSRKTLLDLAGVFFLLGSIIVLIISVLSIPISTIYPTFSLGVISYSYLMAIIIAIIGAILGFDCFYLTTKRNLVSAGVRGIVIGAVLLCVAWITGAQMVGAGSILILIAGIICYIYRD